MSAPLPAPRLPPGQASCTGLIPVLSHSLRKLSVKSVKSPAEGLSPAFVPFTNEPAKLCESRRCVKQSLPRDARSGATGERRRRARQRIACQKMLELSGSLQKPKRTRKKRFQTRPCAHTAGSKACGTQPQPAYRLRDPKKSLLLLGPKPACALCGRQCCPNEPQLRHGGQYPN